MIIENDLLKVLVHTEYKKCQVMFFKVNKFSFINLSMLQEIYNASYPSSAFISVLYCCYCIMNNCFNNPCKKFLKNARIVCKRKCPDSGKVRSVKIRERALNRRWYNYKCLLVLCLFVNYSSSKYLMNVCIPA